MGALAGEIRDDLVRVHVRAGAGAGLEDVDRELVVVAAVCDLVTGGSNALGEIAVEQAEVRVDARGGRLDAAEPADDRHRDRVPAHREVGYGFLGLAAPELAAFVSRAHALDSRARIYPEPEDKAAFQPWAAPARKPCSWAVRVRSSPPVSASRRRTISS